MKLIKILSVVACTMALLAGPAMGAEKSKDKTCCEKAAADGKECTHKCCVAAHKEEGKSCEKCNSDKQDLKLKKEKKKAAKDAAKTE